MSYSKEWPLLRLVERVRLWGCRFGTGKSIKKKFVQLFTWRVIFDVYWLKKKQFLIFLTLTCFRISLKNSISYKVFFYFFWFFSSCLIVCVLFFFEFLILDWLKWSRVRPLDHFEMTLNRSIRSCPRIF